MASAHRVLASVETEPDHCCFVACAEADDARFAEVGPAATAAVRWKRRRGTFV